MRVRPEEKRRRWEKLQKQRIFDLLYKIFIFDGEEYQGTEITQRKTND